MQRLWLWLGFETAPQAFRGPVLPPNTPQVVLNRVRGLNSPECPACVENSQPNTLRGIVSISLREKYEDACTAGWTPQAHFLRESCLSSAQDALRVHIADAFFFPLWEAMPHVTKRARVAHRDVRLGSGVAVTAKMKAGAIAIHEWCLEAEADQEAVDLCVQNLSVQRANSESIVTVRDVVGSDTAGKLKGLPCLFVPAWIGQLIFSKKWFDLVLLGRWGSQCQPLREHLQVVMQERPASSVCLQPACLTAEGAGRCIESLRDAFAKLAMCEPDADQVAGSRMEILQCIEALSCHRDSLFPNPDHVKKFAKLEMHSSFLRQVLAALDLSNRGKLKAHAKKFLQCIPEGLRPGSSAWVESTFMSASSLCIGRLMLDIAMLLFHRARLAAKGSCLRYVWGDSTSKDPWDIYNARYRSFRSEQAVPLARAWRWLCLHQPSVNQEETLGEDVQTQRALKSQLLFDSIELRTLLPQLLGQGRTKLLDKVAAHIQSSLLEAGDLTALEADLASCVSWCSDMGVEAGLPECEVQGVESVLPTFIRPMRIEVIQGVDEGFVQEEVLVPEAPEARRLMPDALHLPGCCHAIHNACLNLDSALADFSWFLGLLKKFDPLIADKRKRERFLEVALEGTPQYDEGKKVLANFSATLHTERWGELATYLRTGFPALVFCRQHWDGVAYARGLDEKEAEGANFSCSSITALLKDDFFFVYWQMQLALRDIIEALLRFVEGCACHSSHLKGRSAFQQEKALRSEIECPKDVHCQCPLMGCRAPEMAVGHLETFAEELFGTEFGKFISRNPTVLNSEQWGRLSQEWHKAGAYILENLKIRLGFFQSLPWIILGGAHPSPQLAKACLRQALSLWDALPENTKTLQHAKAKQLFEAGAVRSDLDHFLLPETCLENCPALEAFLAPLSFVQTAERIIEGAHKDLGALPTSHSMTALSVHLRVPELNRCLTLQPDCFATLLESFQRARKIRQFERHFPSFGTRPLLQDLKRQGGKVSSGKYVKALRLILYRDASVQHADMKVATVFHKRQKAQLDRRKKALQPKGQSLGEALVYGEAATAHIRAVLSADTGAVLSVGSDLYGPILLRPAAIHLPSHAPGTLHVYNKNDLLVMKLDNEGSGSEPVVTALSEGVGGGEALNLCRLAQASGVDSFLESVRVWRKPGKVQLSLPDIAEVPAAALSQVLQRMIDEHALPGCVTGIVGARNEEGPLQAMRDRGWVEDAGVGVRLTQDAVSAISFNHCLASPQQLREVRALPLSELHEFELMVQMRAQGWVWLPLPSSREKRSQVEPYKNGGHLNWYSAGATVSKSYLLCLLNADKLAADHGISAIPHVLPAEAYNLILAGQQPRDALVVLQQRGGAARKRAATCLEIDVDGVTAVLPGMSGQRVAPRALPKPPVQVAPESNQGEGSAEPLLDTAEDSPDELVADLEALIDAYDEQESMNQVQGGPTCSRQCFERRTRCARLAPS